MTVTPFSYSFLVLCCVLAAMCFIACSFLLKEMKETASCFLFDRVMLNVLQVGKYAACAMIIALGFIQS